MTKSTSRKGSSAEQISFFKVSGLDCGSCAVKIETTLGKIPGVETVDAAITSETVIVHHRDNVSTAALATKLDALGYGVSATAKTREELEKTISALPQGAANDDHDHGANGHDHAAHDHASGDHAKHEHAKAGDRREHEEGETDDHDGHDHSHARDDSVPWWRAPDGMLVISCALIIAAAYVIGFFAPGIDKWAMLLAMAVGIIPVARKAWRGIVQGFPFSIDTLMVVAALGAVALNAIEEAAVVVVLFLMGELLESIASNRARRGIRGLVDLIPQTALVEQNGQLVEKQITDLTIGTTIVVRPGDRISADGEILSGISSIDDSPVTGESAPKTKKPGDNVYAGSINHDASLRIRVSTDTANNTIRRIARMVEEAQDRKSPTQRFINKFSSIYTPIIFFIGLITAIVPPLLFGQVWDTWIYRGLAVLLIGCPCALVISTPAAIASGIASGTRRGLLVKGGEVLEKLAKVTAVALDKTGTLTTGIPSVTDVKAFGEDEAVMINQAAAVEAASSHPLAKAILALAKSRSITAPVAEDSNVVLGKGVTGMVDGKSVFVGSPKLAAEQASLSDEQQSFIEKLYNEGKTVAVVVVDKTIAGIIGLRDEPKADAMAGMAALTRDKVRAIMLTGDNKATAEAIAATLGIEARSELLPQDKMRIVTELQNQGEVVAKVGDGINDAPALAQADVGIAMAGGPGGGTDIALETGDAAILRGNVSDIAGLIDLARRTMRNIHQNLTIAIGLKALFLVTTILGITGLWPAILADTGATLLVTANALRLLRAPPVAS